MRDMQTAAKSAGPFTVTAPQPAIAESGSLPARPVRSIGRHAWLWTRHLLTGVGVLTVAAFAIGITPIPEKIGDVTGRVAAAAISAQTDAQAKQQGAIAQAGVVPQQELQAWQVALQGDLAALNSALAGVQTILVNKANADLQGRNALLQLNAQLQGDRVRQIMQIQAMLEQGNITSAQVADMLKNLGNALQMDTSRLQSQSQDIKAKVMDAVTQVTPISEDNGSGITDPLKPGGILDPDVQVALADIERRVSTIQERFTIRTMPPRPIQVAQP